MEKYNKPSLYQLNMIRTAICFCFILDSWGDSDLGFHLIWGYGSLEQATYMCCGTVGIQDVFKKVTFGPLSCNKERLCRCLLLFFAKSG